MHKHTSSTHHTCAEICKVPHVLFVQVVTVRPLMSSAVAAAQHRYSDGPTYALFLCKASGVHAKCDALTQLPDCQAVINYGARATTAG